LDLSRPRNHLFDADSQCFSPSDPLFAKVCLFIAARASKPREEIAMSHLKNFLISAAVIPAYSALLPGAASAQSSLAGIVKDASGAVLPGVTVEASSPALIEGSRSGISDEKGQYKIVDLRPGIYTVVFTLPGFNTFKRDGIELPANFTATVNAELQVGVLEQTVTVTGDTPLVATTNAVNEQILPLQLIDTGPMG